ncbi:dihydroorotase [Caldiplasma sukawensis]
MVFEVVYEGRFYYKNEFKDLYVHTENGYITKISQSINHGRAIKIPGGILPAFTDIHVHFRDPGETEKEDFSTGSLAALFGGTTTVLDMPNNRTPIRDYETFMRKKSAINKRSYVDYGFYAMYDGTNGSIMPDENCGIKIYMGESTNTKGADIDYGNDNFLNEYGKPVIFHGETLDCLEKNVNIEAKNTREYNLKRPSECEEEAVKRILKVKAERKIMAHVSDVTNIDGSSIITEMTPHHMLLHDNMDLGSLGKVNPPLREKRTMEKNFQYFLDGKINILSSDHAPHQEKDKEEFQFAKAGIPGVETRIPIMLSLVRRKILPLETLLNTGSKFPSSYFGIPKGEIDVGMRADFISVDFSNEKKIDQNRLHSKNPITPFDGFYAIFPSTVVMGGEIAIENYEFIDEPMGKYLNFKEVNSTPEFQ